jgi:type II secretory pathway component PulF
MKHEELAYVNQQLAGMLKSGLPLEAALRELCADMKRGALREELRQLEADLAKGTPLREALAARRLPEFYIRMLQLGARSQDLPGVLILMADHYQRAELIWTRLKGLLVYPALVLLGSLGVSLLIAYLVQMFFAAGAADLAAVFEGVGRSTWSTPSQVFLVTALPCLLLAGLATAALVATGIPTLRRRLRWILPAFRETSLSNLGATMSLILAKGGTLGEACDLAARLERGTPAETEIELWKRRLAGGQTKFAELAAGGRAFPRLFGWLVAQGGEDVAAGFRRAAEVYYARAVYRTELLLYLVLPLSVLMLGLMIILQFTPVLRQMILFIDLLGSVGG